MGKTISIKDLALVVKKIKNQGKKTVVVGGCFDILHPGHVTFLEKAKQAGDLLVVLLESDQKVRELKGANRPVHTQSARALILSVLTPIDYVVMLPYMKNAAGYDELISKIGPGVIAASAKSAYIYHQRAAKAVGAKFKIVTKAIKGYSSSKLVTVQ